MLLLHSASLITAFVCLIMATFGVPARLNLVALGLALWLLAVLIIGK